MGEGRSSTEPVRSPLATFLLPTRPIAPIRPEMVAINRLDQAQRSIGPLPIMGRTLPITVKEPTEGVGDRRNQGSDRTAADRERGPDKRETAPEQAVIGMIGGIQEHLDLRACLDDQRVLCKALMHFLLLLRFLCGS